jgi:hypothetical protein
VPGQLAERWLACQLAPFAADVGPSRDQVFVGACQAAQAHDLLRASLLVLTLAFRKPELDPGFFSEQVRPPDGHFAELGRARGFLGFGKTSPAGMTPGDSGNPGYEQPVGIRAGAVSGHGHDSHLYSYL